MFNILVFVMLGWSGYGSLFIAQPPQTHNSRIIHLKASTTPFPKKKHRLRHTKFTDIPLCKKRA